MHTRLYVAQATIRKMHTHLYIMYAHIYAMYVHLYGFTPGMPPDPGRKAYYTFKVAFFNIKA